MFTFFDELISLSGLFATCTLVIYARIN